MIIIYHNTRCSKSREGLEVLEASDKDFKVREYLKDPLNKAEIEGLLDKLQLTPIQLIRKNENIWKEKYKGKDLSDRELIEILVQNPKLMERPIVETDKEAVIGRPKSNIEEIL